jgi:hypothetical protein
VEKSFKREFFPEKSPTSWTIFSPLPSRRPVGIILYVFTGIGSFWIGYRAIFQPFHQSFRDSGEAPEPPPKARVRIV